MFYLVLLAGSREMETKPTAGVEPNEFSLPSTLYPLLSKGKVCILGVGNRMHGDDGVGSLLVDRISGRISVDCMDAGIAPENFLEKIVKLAPDTVLIVDAVDFGGRHGEIRIFNPQDIVCGGISTHALSLQMVCEYLKERIPVRVFLIGIQPQAIGLGQELSSIVAKALDSLAAILLDLCKSEIKIPAQVREEEKP